MKWWRDMETESEVEVESKGPPGSDRACLPDHYGSYPCARTHTCKYIHLNFSIWPFSETQCLVDERHKESNLSSDLDRVSHGALVSKEQRCAP